MVEDIKIDDIKGVSKTNVRQSDVLDVTELADSIKEKGILQPLILRPTDDDKYEVVVGQRRYLAAKQIGLKKVPADVKKLKNGEAVSTSFIENIQRGDLNAEDEANAVAKLYEIYGTQKKTAEAIPGKTEHWIRNRLKAKGIIDTFKEHSKKPLPAAVTVDASKATEIGQTAEKLWPDKKDKQADFFEKTKNLKRRDLRKVKDYAKLHPRKKPENIVKEATQVKTIEVNLEFPPKLAKPLDKAARERNLRNKDIVKIAVEEWLKRTEYL